MRAILRKMNREFGEVVLKACRQRFLYATAILGLSGTCAMASNAGSVPFSCDAASSNAAAVLASYRQELGDTRQLPKGVDSIKALLITMRRGDQDIRTLAVSVIGRCSLQAYPDAVKAVRSTVRSIDHSNKQMLERLLQETGWPVISLYGEEADQTAFLVAQHADRDVRFQRRVLAILEEKLLIQETSGENYALLFDRVKTAEAKPQRYGSQGTCVGRVWVPKPLEDSKHVDEFRNSVGLGPLAEYRQRVSELMCTGNE